MIPIPSINSPNSTTVKRVLPPVAEYEGVVIGAEQSKQGGAGNHEAENQNADEDGAFVRLLEAVSCSPWVAREEVIRASIVAADAGA